MCVYVRVYVCVLVLWAVGCNIQCARSGCFGALYWVYEAGVFRVGVSCDKGRSPLGCHLHMLAGTGCSWQCALALALVGNQGTALQAACRAGAWPRACVLIGQPSRSVPHLLVAVIVEYLIRQQVPTPEASQPCLPACLALSPEPWRAASVIPAANVILCNAKCQHREAVIVPCWCLSQTKRRSSRPLWYTHAPARHCSETSRDLSTCPAFRTPHAFPVPTAIGLISCARGCHVPLSTSLRSSLRACQPW